MKQKINYRSELEVYRYVIHKLNEEVIDELISFVRQVKQTKANLIILEFSKDLLKVDEQLTVAQRLNWSKKGQEFTRFVINSPFPVIGVAKGEVFNEYLEILLSCEYIFAHHRSKFEFISEKNQYLTRFGCLQRFYENKINSTSFLNKLNILVNEYLNLKKENLFSDSNELDEKIKKYIEDIKKTSLYTRRLISICNSSSPLDIGKYEYLESTIYANQPYNEILDNRVYEDGLRPNELIKLSNKNQIDDLANDYLNLTCYPDEEVNTLNKKYRLEEVGMLLEQNIAPIKGRCIELGSGYGYFSSIISRSDRVKEAVALDISMTEIMQLGPYMWDFLKPNWEKLRFLITDMNKIKDSYGTYDTVIFCASLHHSGNIPLSLEIANKLLKPGGSLIIHGEHWQPVFFRSKKREKNYPQTIIEFSKLLGVAGFKTFIFRYALPTHRFPFFLKKIIFTIFPFMYINAWVRFANFMVLGVKK